MNCYFSRIMDNQAAGANGKRYIVDTAEAASTSVQMLIISCASGLCIDPRFNSPTQAWLDYLPDGVIYEGRYLYKWVAGKVYKILYVDQH